MSKVKIGDQVFSSIANGELVELIEYSQKAANGDLALIPADKERGEMVIKRDKIWDHYQEGKVDGGPLDGAPYYIGLHYMKWYVLMKKEMYQRLSEGVDKKKRLVGLIVSAGVSHEKGHKEIERVLEASGILEWDEVGNVKEVYKPDSKLYVTESTDVAVESIKHSVESLIHRGVPKDMIEIIQWDLVNYSPFLNDKVDFIFSALVTCYFTKNEQEKIWEEFYRILKKDGVLIQSMITTQRGDTVFIPTKNTGNPFVKIFTLLTSPTLWPLRIPGTKVGALPKYIEWMSSGYAKMSEKALKEGWFEYLSPEVLMELAEKIGFKENKYYRNSEFWEKSIPIVVTENKK